MTAPAPPTAISAGRALGRAAGLRTEERALLRSAGAVFALASGGAAMAAAAADAMFLSSVGAAHLGAAVAASSALLAVVLAVVGGLADRLERRRVLAALSAASAVALAGLAALSIALPRAAAISALVGGKQLAAATDLAFWVVIAERLDARRSQRLVPMLAATGGIGAAVGSALVVPLAAAVGARGVLAGGALMLACAAIGAARLGVTRRVAGAGGGAASLGRAASALRGLVPLIARSWRDGARAARRHSLARHLALLVGAAGVFASLAYFALGVAVAAKHESAADLAALLGMVRGAGQLATLGVQLWLAPKLLARLGTGPALLLAPLGALAAGLGLVAAPILAVAIATQVSAKVLDAGIETPAEKLAQTLLPGAVRGRIAGFLDGTAKRAGAVLGGLVAALLAGAPLAFYLATAAAAAIWLLAASRIARELPALAIEHVVHDADPDAVVDDRAVAVLVRELDGPRPERAAEVLARLHAGGRIDAAPPLARAATERGGAIVWRALVGVLDAPAELLGPSLADALSDVRPRERELALRALGLAGGAPAAAVSPWLADPDAAIALTAEVASLRIDGRAADVLALLGDAVRDSGPRARAAIDELCAEVARALAAADGRAEGRRALGAASIVSLNRAPAATSSRTSSPAAEPVSSRDLDGRGALDMLEAARHLARALRRGRGDRNSRAAGFAALARVAGRVRELRSAELALLRADLLELARDRVETGASAIAPEHMLTSLVRPAHGGSPSEDVAPEVAAALGLYGALLEGADAIEPDDLRRVARALGEPDDAVRAAAEAALAALGPAAAGELIETAAWGRRRARDRAAALLADLPVTAASLDRLIDAELDALDQTHAARAALDPALAAPAPSADDALLARRFDERLGEIAHTVLLLLAARHRSRSIAAAAAAWRHARGAHERARTLAVIETAVPRALVGRLVEAVDALTPAERAAALARAGIERPARDAVMRAELAGRDRLARALALHALDAAGRSAHRDTIAEAARAEALATAPHDLLRKLAGALAPAPDVPRESEPLAPGDDMPSRVETLIALGRVPLLAALSTRQLADVAERARWTPARAGSILVTAGDALDALIVVEDGELALGERRFGKGDVVDELACVAPLAVPADLRAVRAARLIRLERVDFEELVDDVPGLAAAVCRALGERARRAEDRSYRSPLASTELLGPRRTS